MTNLLAGDLLVMAAIAAGRMLHEMAHYGYVQRYSDSTRIVFAWGIPWVTQYDHTELSSQANQIAAIVPTFLYGPLLCGFLLLWSSLASTDRVIFLRSFS